MLQNNSPHTGISFRPCAATSPVPRIAAGDFQGGILAAIILAELGQIGRGRLQCAGCWPVAFTVGSVADGAISRVHFLARNRRGCGQRHMLDGCFRLIVGFVLCGDQAEGYNKVINIKINFLGDIALSPFTPSSLPKPKRLRERKAIILYPSSRGRRLPFSTSQLFLVHDCFAGCDQGHKLLCFSSPGFEKGNTRGSGLSIHLYLPRKRAWLHIDV